MGTLGCSPLKPISLATLGNCKKRVQMLRPTRPQAACRLLSLGEGLGTLEGWAANRQDTNQKSTPGGGISEGSVS